MYAPFWGTLCCSTVEQLILTHSSSLFLLEPLLCAPPPPPPPVQLHCMTRRDPLWFRSNQCIRVGSSLFHVRSWDFCTNYTKTHLTIPLKLSDAVSPTGSWYQNKSTQISHLSIFYWSIKLIAQIFSTSWPSREQINELEQQSCSFSTTCNCTLTSRRLSWLPFPWIHKARW